MENIPENIEDSLLDSLDDQASILTIDLYLSLEKKREEENERIRNKLDNENTKGTDKLNIHNEDEEESFLDISESKMPIGLIKGNRRIDKDYVKGKLTHFAE